MAAVPAEGGASRFPYCDIILANVNPRRVDAWLRRFARACQNDEDIPSGLDNDDVKDLLENALNETCKGEWERENLTYIVQNDGTVEKLEELIVKLRKRIHDKADAGVGTEANRSR